MMITLNTNNLTFKQIKNLDLEDDEILEIALNKLPKEDRYTISNTWENGTISDHLMLPYFLRDTAILKTLIQLVLNIEDITVSTIKNLYLDEPSKIEFEVHDNETGLIHDIDLCSCEHANVFNAFTRSAGCVMPRFGPDARYLYTIYLCYETGTDFDSPTFHLVNRVTSPRNGTEEELEIEFKNVGIVVDTSKYAKLKTPNDDMYALSNYFQGKIIEDDFIKLLDNHITEVKKDKSLQLEFTFKYIYFILQLE